MALFFENGNKKIKENKNIQSRSGTSLCLKAGPDTQVMKEKGDKDGLAEYDKEPSLSWTRAPWQRARCPLCSHANLAHSQAHR